MVTRMRRRKASAEVLEFAIDGEDYKRFESFAAVHHLSQDDALRSVLIAGMKRYWPQQLAHMETDYDDLKETLEDYTRDNEILGRIDSQNNELKALLGQFSNDRKGK